MLRRALGCPGGHLRALLEDTGTLSAPVVSLSASLCVSELFQNEKWWAVEWAPKDVGPLVPRSCEYGDLHGKRDFADVRSWGQGDYLGECSHKGLHSRGRGKQESQSQRTRRDSRCKAPVMGEGPEPGAGMTSGGWKGRKHLPPNLGKERRPTGTLTLSSEYHLGSDLQFRLDPHSCAVTNMGCFKSLSLA